MRVLTAFIIFFLIGVIVNAKSTDTKKMDSSQVGSMMTKNPLLQEWQGGYGGVPPFDKVNMQHFTPALEIVIKDFNNQLEAIASQKELANFVNTIEALEKMSPITERMFPIYGVWSANLSTPEFQKIQSAYAPKLAALMDAVVQNTALFKRIETVHQNRNKSKLNPEQIRLVEHQYKSFIQRGAKLNASQKKKVAAINQKLATLSNDFSDKVLKDEDSQFVLIEKQEFLTGLSASLIESYAAEATRRGQKGKWAVANTRSSAEPFLTSSSNRPLREKVFKMWTTRGDQGGKTDTNKIISKIVKLRTERSKILGFPSYAHWNLTNTMAKDPKTTLDLMMKVWTPALARAKEEVKDMQIIVDKEKGGFKIEPWDYRFYAEKVRKEKFDLDMDSLKPYLQLDNVAKAMFWTAKELFGLKFTQVKDVPVFYPDMSVYKVTDLKNKFVGLWYFDPYARAGKRSGAWMTSYRVQQRMDGQDISTLVSNNSNFIKGKKGELVLISWDDAVTMFHEFGHALHGLTSNVTYPTLSGTSVLSDYVEFPSQILENFLSTKEVLNFLKDSKGRKIPKPLLAKLQKAKTFNQGFSTVEFLGSAIVDMKLHLEAGRKTIDPKAFEKKVLKDIGMPAEIVMRHRLPHFNHLFASEGYAAGYYGYLWAQVLEKDAFEAFSSAKNTYDKAVSKKLKDFIFAPGNTIDPNEAYRKFRGRDAKVDALLKARGFM
jgi:peptidyl-dipeptidase Dcp